MNYGKSLSEQELKSIASVLGATESILSKANLKDLMIQEKLHIADDGYRSNQYVYRLGLNKRDWLYNCFADTCNQEQSFDKIYCFIEAAMNPIRYAANSDRSRYFSLKEELNKVLLLIGLFVDERGKLLPTKQASTLEEVDERVNHLNAELQKRCIHYEVKKYCKKELLQKDFFDAVFEASKGLAQRVREISGMQGDGGQLFQQAFSLKNPSLFFNSLRTESEKSEFTGLSELLQAIFHLVRNPAAHTPKINWKVEEEKALDILTVISFAHKYLDECRQMLGKLTQQ